MKAIVVDSAVLATIGPIASAAYLRSRGWSREVIEPGFSEVWRLSDEQGGFEVLLPLNRELADYALRMGEMLQTLSVAEQRSQLEILTDVSLASADVVRLRVTGAETADGSIAIDDGVTLVDSARAVLLAAACSAHEPRRSFPTRKPRQAVEYLEKARLGQTERGSYTVTMVSTVAPSLTASEDGRLFDTPDTQEPFARRVTLTLARAVTKLRTAAEVAVAESDLQPFEDAVCKGVSADLCEAVTGIGAASPDSGAMHLAITWSPARPVPEATPSRAVVPHDYMPVVEEAGRLLRSREPREDFLVLGPVVRLERSESQGPGRITVTTLVDEVARRVSVELQEAEYHVAIHAHDHADPVACRGSLRKEGSTFALLEPRDFDIAPGDDES